MRTSRTLLMMLAVVCALLGFAWWALLLPAGTISIPAGRVYEDSAENVDVDSNGVATTILTIQDARGIEFLHCEFNNEDVPATTTGLITGFAAQKLYRGAGSYYNWLTATDWDSTDIPTMVFATMTGPQEVNTNGTAEFEIRPDGAKGVRFQATAASLDEQTRVNLWCTVVTLGG